MRNTRDPYEDIFGGSVNPFTDEDDADRNGWVLPGWDEPLTVGMFLAGVAIFAIIVLLVA